MTIAMDFFVGLLAMQMQNEKCAILQTSLARILNLPQHTDMMPAIAPASSDMAMHCHRLAVHTYS